MTPAEYKSERKKRGTQKEVAARLGVCKLTIVRREAAQTPVSEEAALAIRALSVLP